MEASREFSEATLRDLARNNARIYAIPQTSTSLNELVGKGAPIWRIFTGPNKDIKDIPARHTQVAFFPTPAGLYIPESNNLGLEAQKKLLKVHQQEIIKVKMGIGGVEEVIDNVATITNLAIVHSMTGIQLHGINFDFRYAVTKTATVGHFVACVGNWVSGPSILGGGGLNIDDFRSDIGHMRVWVMSLLVPALE